MSGPRALIAHPYPIVVDALSAAAAAAGYVAERAADPVEMRQALARRPALAIVDAGFGVAEGAQRTLVIDDVAAANVIRLTAKVEQIASTIAAVAQEQRARSPVPTPVLTPRERDVVRHVAAGRRNRTIATTLGVAEGTVKMHLHNVYAKLGLESRTQLAMAARSLGLG